MKRYFNKLMTCALVCTICLSVAVPVFAAESKSELTTAAAYLREKGIMVGDKSGDMMLNRGLNRAELAVLLTRLAGNIDHVIADQDYYISRCEFTDVPAWAKAYVGYCYSVGLISGYGDGRYGSEDNVTPAAACTVILRFLETPVCEWSYNTACDKVSELGLSTQLALGGSETSRGDMALLIYRALGSPALRIEAPSTDAEAISAPITIPADELQFIPKVGDVILCEDGSTYFITNTSRYNNNIFASDPVGDLPTATCDWSRFPDTVLPDADVRHFSNETGDTLFIRNLYETRRMEHTIYNALGTEPSAWNHGTPLATVEPSIPGDLDAYTSSFWPWRASELEKLVHSRPNSRFYVEAWDYYLNGVFQYTRYCVTSQ